MLRIYDDWEEARGTVLRRRDMMVLDDVPEPVRAGIRRVFGKELTPEAGVARILADVRQRGDAGTGQWSELVSVLGESSASAVLIQEAIELLREAKR